MITAISSATSRVNQGKCPHGLPLGACPICSGMQGGGGGGGAKATRKGEMSWDQCYAMGLVMKSQTQRAEATKQFEMNGFMAAIARSRVVQAIAKQVANIAAFIQTNISQPISNFVGKVTNTITRPFKRAFNAMANSTIARGIKTAANFVKKGLINISDKIAATIGEPMTAVANFLSENWRKIKPKRFIFFSEVDTGMEQGDQDEEVELKRILSLKTFKENIHKLFKVNKKDKRWSQA